MKQPMPLLAIDVAELPELLKQWMPILAIGLGALVLIWLILAFRTYSYNLTRAETAPLQKKATPEFLKPDREAREAALERGDAYARERAERGRPRPREDWISGITFGVRIGAVILAVASLVLAVMACMNLASQPDTEFANLTAGERWNIVFNHYWVALVLSVVLLAVEAVRLARARLVHR